MRADKGQVRLAPVAGARGLGTTATSPNSNRRNEICGGPPRPRTRPRRTRRAASRRPRAAPRARTRAARTSRAGPARRRRRGRHPRTNSLPSPPWPRRKNDDADDDDVVWWGERRIRGQTAPRRAVLSQILDADARQLPLVRREGRRKRRRRIDQPRHGSTKAAAAARRGGAELGPTLRLHLPEPRDVLRRLLHDGRGGRAVGPAPRDLET